MSLFNYIIDIAKTRQLEKGELRFKCKKCNKRNKTMRGLKLHLIRKHGVIQK